MDKIENLTDTAFTIEIDGKKHPVSYKEIAIANNLTLESLITVLVNKGVLSREELLKELSKLREEKYKV
jgi:hypothetical protein